MANSKTVLVTGGAGYIGAHTCKELAAHGFAPLVYDNFSTGHPDFVRWGEFVHGDIQDVPRLTRLLLEKKPLGVLHFASSIAVGESVEKPDKYYRNNVYGTLCLLEAMLTAGVRDIVVSGTAAVYGHPDEVPIPESAPFDPASPYGCSKAMVERLLLDFETAYGFRTAVLRYFNAAGADPEGEIGERHEPETHLIPNIFRAACGLIPALKLFGVDYPTPDGSCLRDYIHVCDLASAHRLALEKLVGGQKKLRLNLGTGFGYSVKEVIEHARRVIGKPVPFKVEERRAGDVPALVARADLARKTIGWIATRSSLDSILSTAWRWFEKDSLKKVTL
ncbi:MAG: UDP-glucose 4-epimerase GalE [Deltaproteobacteria bacterium]|jgi:UDP-glucose-4-epimerase GalE|nr:UDP-glucose 4-epimerase GalE [Deltaproteobacteria bacterium]